MKIVKMSAVERTEGTAPLFTGPVGRQAILDPDDSNNFNFGIVHFGAGVRNKFHTHSGDQILIVTEGTGIVATRDEEVTVTEGDVAIIPAGEDHWHGSRETAMSHITITVKGSQTQQKRRLVPRGTTDNRRGGFQTRPYFFVPWCFRA